MFSIRYPSLNHGLLFWPRHLVRSSPLSQLCPNPTVVAEKGPESSKNLYNDVVAKIGLEVHAQLNVSSKLFSQGANSSQAPPNSQLDLLDVSLPGTLPKLNGVALRAAILSSLGLNCTVQNMIHFDRKNYFYTDMPAGFQITQYNKPIAKNGYIDFIVTTYHRSVIAHSQQYDLVKYLYSEDRQSIEDFAPYMKRSHIKQIQLEQDSAKTLEHISADNKRELCNLVDYNRSGTGLIEVVFEPDLTNHHEASSLVKELMHVLSCLNTCDCELQEGSLRVDANVSIDSISGQAIKDSRRVELKNLNSLRALNRGIFYEIRRQADLIRSGGVVQQESRTYDTRSNETKPLRVKEEAVDYRYVPEPSIPPLRIDEEMIQEIKQELPGDLPSKVRRDLLEFNLDLALVAEIMAEPGLSHYFIEIMRRNVDYEANMIADFLVYTIANLRTIVGPPIQVDFDSDSDFSKRLSIDKMQIIFDMMLQEEISFTTAYEVIKYIFTSNDESDPRKIVNDLGWYQINDHAEVNKLCADLIAGMKNVPKKYSKKGEKRYLRLMLVKLCELTDNKVSVKRAIESLNKQLKPPPTPTSLN